MKSFIILSLIVLISFVSAKKTHEYESVHKLHKGKYHDGKEHRQQQKDSYYHKKHMEKVDHEEIMKHSLSVSEEEAKTQLDVDDKKATDRRRGHHDMHLQHLDIHRHPNKESSSSKSEEKVASHDHNKENVKEEKNKKHEKHSSHKKHEVKNKDKMKFLRTRSEHIGSHDDVGNFMTFEHLKEHKHEGKKASERKNHGKKEKMYKKKKEGSDKKMKKSHAKYY